jgi:hypothetical protein
MKATKFAASITGLRSLSFSLFFGLVALLASNSAYAKSDLLSVTLEPEWPTSTQPGNVIVYQVTVTREGQGMILASLNIAGLPEGATATFSPATVRFTGRALKKQTCILTITTPQVMSLENYPFTVTATSQRESIVATPKTSRAMSVSASSPLMLDLASQTSLRLRGTGSSGQSYQIESTPDLAHPVWTAIGTTTADGNGRYSFFTELDKTATTRFFRATLIPAL